MSMEANPPKADAISSPRLDRYSTAVVAPGMRLEYWREVMSKAVIAASASSCNRDNFRGEITSQKFSDITFNCFDSGGHQIVRLVHDFRHVHGRTFILSLQLSGRAQIEQCRRMVVLAPQSMCLVDAMQPFTVSLFGEVKRMVAALPYSLVYRHLPRVRQVGALQVDPAHPCTDLIREYVMRLSTPQFAIDRVAGELMSEHLCELLGIVVSRQLGTESAPSSSRQFHKTVLLAYLKRNALDPQLTPRVTARDLGMSVRSVHSLMRDIGQTFSEWVLNARVTHAHRLLQSTGVERRKIADIAATCGFSDLSHFNRMFKARVGCTPSEARALANTAASS